MTRLPRFSVYLLIAHEDGTIYTGYTTNVRRRFKRHNRPEKRRYTDGKRWHLLAVKHFLDTHTALLFERQVKKNRRLKHRWINSTDRARILCERHGIQYGYVQ